MWVRIPPVTLRGSWLLGLAHALAVLQKRLGENDRLAVAQDRFGRILGEVDPPGFGRAIETTAVEAGAGENGDAAGGADDRLAGIIAVVAHPVVGLLVLDVLDSGLRARPRIGEHVDSSVFLGHVIQRAPARDVRLMWQLYVPAVLMPGELHPHFRRLDDVLLAEQPRRLADGRPAEFG